MSFAGEKIPLFAKFQWPKLPYLFAVLRSGECGLIQPQLLEVKGIANASRDQRGILGLLKTL